MKTKIIVVVLLTSLLLSSLAIVNVFASNGYFANDYDFSNYPPPANSIDTTPHANTAATYQYNDGYFPTATTNDNAYDAWSKLPWDENIFFFDGHGNAGGIYFHDGNWIDEQNGVYDVQDYSTSSLTPNLLAVYAACDGGNTDPTYGNLLWGANYGIGCVVAWTSEIEVDHTGTWVDRFWDDMHSGQSVTNAGNDAASWVGLCYSWEFWDQYGGTNNWVTSGNAGLSILPARAG